MRRWLAQRAVGRVRHANETRITWEKENEARKRSEKDERIRREYERRMNPKTREDFDLLYHALESKCHALPSVTTLFFSSAHKEQKGILLTRVHVVESETAAHNPNLI